MNVATVRANIFNAYAADTSFTFSLTAPGTMPAATPPPGTAVQGQYTLGTKSDPVNGYKTDPVGASRPFWTGQSYFFPLNAALCARYGTVTADGFGCLTQLNGQGLNFQADPAITLYLDLISINARYLHTG